MQNKLTPRSSKKRGAEDTEIEMPKASMREGNGEEESPLQPTMGPGSVVSSPMGSGPGERCTKTVFGRGSAPAAKFSDATFSISFQ